MPEPRLPVRFRAGALAGSVVALARLADGEAGFADALRSLDASVIDLPGAAEDDDAAAQHVRAALDAHGRIDFAALDVRDALGSRTPAAPDAAELRGALAAVWTLTRALAVEAMIPEARGGRVVFVAPCPGEHAHAGPARAALENLARTLSIEWSRFAVDCVAITPGDVTGDGELAALLAYLASPAGGYFSGCRLSLGEVEIARPS